MVSDGSGGLQIVLSEWVWVVADGFGWFWVVLITTNVIS